MMLKLVLAAVVIFGLWWAYGHYSYTTTDICIANAESMLPLNCEVQADCITMLTSAYVSSYPNTALFTNILGGVTSCKEGMCYLKSFDFKDNLVNPVCGLNQTTMTYKVTVKDVLAIKR